jgi:bifunctional N-acetylglucosamine-1-phosphate-uridyltransferase/glucosamine-1-phosphate-acetyltransferase GlmU-like protein
MGKSAVEYVLGVACAVAPGRVIVAADEVTEQIKDLSAAGQPAVTVLPVDVTKEGALHVVLKAAGGAETLLFVSGSLPLISAKLLRDIIEEHRNVNVPCRTTSVGAGPDAGFHTVLFVADAPLTTETPGAPPVEKLTFEDRMFSLIQYAAQKQGAVRDFVPAVPGEAADVRSPRGFAAALASIRLTIVDRLMDEGVTVIDPARTYVDAGVVVGEGTTLYPDTYLEGKTRLGKGCVIEPNVKIVDSVLADNVLVKMCTAITESSVGRGVQIGPFAHLRPKTELMDEVKIGNFVEVKKSTIGKGSKASHLSYIGDAKVGAAVNVGAGTITCNYDGVNKHLTQIGDGVFIGSDSQFVAPVVVGEYALIGAGSTITKDVPPNALAVGRARQINIPDRGVKSKK